LVDLVVLYRRCRHACRYRTPVTPPPLHTPTRYTYTLQRALVYRLGYSRIARRSRITTTHTTHLGFAEQAGHASAYSLPHTRDLPRCFYHRVCGLRIPFTLPTPRRCAARFTPLPTPLVRDTLNAQRYLLRHTDVTPTRFGFVDLRVVVVPPPNISPTFHTRLDMPVGFVYTTLHTATCAVDVPHWFSGRLSVVDRYTHVPRILRYTFTVPRATFQFYTLRLPFPPWTVALCAWFLHV